MAYGKTLLTDFLYALSFLIYFHQGCGNLASQPLYFYFREHMHLGISTIMMMGSITSIPWMVKPLYGLLSDRVPLLGYRRKAYIILSSLLSLLACLTLSLWSAIPLVALIVFLTIDSLGGAIKDVAIDGMMVEEGKKFDCVGKIQSIQWVALGIGQVITGIAGGYIAEHYNYRFAYLLVATLPAAIVFFAFRYKEDKYVGPSVKSNTFQQFKELLQNKQFVLSVCFLFCLWFSPAIGTPIMNKMREQFHMSKIWIGWLSTIGSIFSVIGSALYFKLSKGLNMRKWLTIGIWGSAISTLAYLYLTPASILLYSIVFGLSGAFIQLIMLDYMARICPEGSEATTFALLCSVVNFGGFCSNMAGAKLFDSIGYNGLVWISGLTTLLCLFFIPKLKLDK